MWFYVLCFIAWKGFIMDEIKQWMCYVKDNFSKENWLHVENDNHSNRNENGIWFESKNVNIGHDFDNVNNKVTMKKWKQCI